jgi:hypothetical protein
MENAQGTAIRSQAWSGTGGQDGSETSGVSPNNNPRRERPASLFGERVILQTLRRRNHTASVEEDEIVQASWKREGT